MTDVAIIANPVSGSGRSRAVAERLDAQLQESGFESRLAWTELGDQAAWLDPVLEDASTMLVVGGDGTVRMVADAAVRTRTPLWQVPCGTENLLARSLGMNSDFASIEQALRRNQSRYLDMARANGTTCLLMASAGLDADVVHDLASRRGRSIRHWHYLPCIARQLIRWRPLPMTLHMDGRTVRTEEPGWCIVCNCREYGGRFNPAPDADMTDGLLDVVFLPASSRWQAVRWMSRTRRGSHLQEPGAFHGQARQVQLDFGVEAPWQVDGDRPPEAASPITRRVEISLEPACLPVLLPA